MFIDGLINADAMPALEAVAKLAARRQELIQHNIANFSTPRFEPVDVDVAEFREALARAVDRRREQFGGQRGELPIKSTSTVEAVKEGNDLRLTLHPKAIGENILFHDRNNRDLERIMQDLVENVGTFRVATELWKSRMGLLQGAIREQA